MQTNPRQIARREARHQKIQQLALERIRRHVEEHLNKNPEYGDTIIEWTVKPTTHGETWVTVINEMVKLPEGNLLRILDRQHWLFLIGKRGAITIKMGPKSYQQFNGGRAFGGFNVEIV